MKTKILVKGPALSRSGYGEHSRFVLRALRLHEDKFDIYLQNIPWGKTGWIFEDNEERLWIDHLVGKTTQYVSQKGRFDMSIQVTIPQEFEEIAPINIGATAGTESTMISPNWIEKSNLMNKVIFVSNHTKHAFEKTSYEARNEQTGQIIKDFRCKAQFGVVNYPVRIFEPADINLDLEYDFNFLVMAQYSPRKNLEKTIEWWVEEFIDQKVGLVLKVNIANDSVIDRHVVAKKIKNLLDDNYPKRKCKIYLLHGTMKEEELSTIYQHPKIKAILSLSHGEGFGLPLFEAAYYGLPIVCPEWGGQLDFLYVPTKNKKGKIKNKPHFCRVEYDIKKVQKEAVWEPVIIKDSSWCFPKQGSFKMRIREIKKDYKRYLTMSEKLKKHVRENFKEEKQYNEFVSHLEEFIVPKAGSEDVDELFDKLMNTGASA